MKTPIPSGPPPSPEAGANPIPDSLKAAMHLSFGTFSDSCLRHLRENPDRLIRGIYQDGQNGCLFNLLSRPLAFRIDSKNALSLWFTGEAGPELRDTSPLYLASREVITAWDNGSLQVEHVVEAIDRLLAGVPAPILPLEPDRRPAGRRHPELSPPAELPVPVFAQVLEQGELFDGDLPAVDPEDGDIPF